MTDTSERPRARTVAQDLLATVWPASLPTDSEAQRRKKVAVRSAQLAVVAMVTASVAGALAMNAHGLSLARAGGLVAAALLYIGWSTHGTRRAVQALLWERGTAPPEVSPDGTITPPLPALLHRLTTVPVALWPPGTRWGAAFYFAVQLGLAGLIYHLGGQGHASALAWLVLLPPVGHSVILLPRAGIALVSVLSMAILVLDVAFWYGWQQVPYALAAFSFAVLFTLVFTMLAVSSERSRGQVQRLAAQLSEANLKLRQYAVQAEELAATRERNRLAREIHDSLGHYLTVVNVQLEAARALHDRDPARAHDALDKAQSLTQEGLREIRRSVSALRSSPLDNKPLAEALRQVVAEGRAAGLTADLEVLGAPRPLTPAAELTLYRAGQEGLTNTRKHAAAAHARLALDFRAPNRVSLTVTDDGTGSIADPQCTGGFGLLGLRERAHLLGGTVRVQTAPGAGFTLAVEVPG